MFKLAQMGLKWLIALISDKLKYSLFSNQALQLSEAFFAFAEFSKHYPEGRISFKELKAVLEDIG